MTNSYHQLQMTGLPVLQNGVYNHSTSQSASCSCSTIPCRCPLSMAETVPGSHPTLATGLEAPLMGSNTHMVMSNPGEQYWTLRSGLIFPMKSNPGQYGPFAYTPQDMDSLEMMNYPAFIPLYPDEEDELMLRVSIRSHYHALSPGPWLYSVYNSIPNQEVCASEFCPFPLGVPENQRDVTQTPIQKAPGCHPEFCPFPLDIPDDQGDVAATPMPKDSGQPDGVHPHGDLPDHRGKESDADPYQDNSFHDGLPPYKKISRNRFQCKRRNCSQIVSRLPDLKRHNHSVHNQAQRFFCSYRDCPRNKRGFPRKDKRENHERKVHKRKLYPDDKSDIQHSREDPPSPSVHTPLEADTPSTNCVETPSTNDSLDSTINSPLGSLPAWDPTINFTGMESAMEAWGQIT